MRIRIRCAIYIALCLSALRASAVIYVASPAGYADGSVIGLQIDTSVPRALVHKSGGGTFTSSGTMSLLDSSNNVLASTSYFAGNSVVVVPFSWSFTTGSLTYHALATGNVNPSGNVTVTAYPNVPGGVGAAADSASSVLVSWSATSGATRYKVRNKTTGVESLDITGASYSWGSLNSGATYCFTVIGCNVPNVCGAESVQVCAAPAVPPAPPQNFAASNAAATSVALSWSTASGATRYKVRNKTTGIESPDITGTSYTWPSLISGTSYCFTVIGCNIPNVCGSESLQSCATPGTIPPPPPNVSASADSTSSVLVSWSAEANATRYKVRNNTTGIESPDIAGTSYSWSGLTSGASYCFTVIGCNVPNVCGSESLQSCAAPAKLPAIPANVATSVPSSTSVAITWSAAANATRYKVRNKTTSIESPDVTGTSYTWPNLTTGTSYCFTVIGCNIPNVCGTESAQSCAIPATTPAAPTGVATAADSASSVKISWSSVANATRYKVRNKTAGGESLDITGTSYTWPNLNSGTSYCFTVIACNVPNVCGSESLQSCAAPASVPATPSNVNAAASSSTSVAITWSAAANATRYKVRNKTTGIESPDITGTSYTWPNLTTGTSYCFTVIACNIPNVCGAESAQSCAIPATTPAAPTGVATAADSASAVLITWSPTANAMRYRVRNKTTGTESLDINSTSYVWPSLASGTSYCFTVIACNVATVCGAESAPACAAPATTPPPPATVAASAASETSVAISWSAVAAATRYKVRNKTTGAESLDITGTSYTWPSLTTGTSYCFAVIACNIPKVCGGESNSTCATPQSSCTPPGAFSLSAPADGASARTAPLTLQWSASLSASTYEVRLGTALDSLRAAGSSATPSFVLQSLAPSTKYFWQVAAKASCGAARESAVSSFTTAPAPSATAALYSSATPLNRTSGVVAQTTFVWSVDAENASSVFVELRNPVLNLTTPYPMTTATPGASRRTYSYQQALNTATTYSYRFRADGTGGPVYWPADRSFYSGPEVTAPAGCERPGAFALATPANGAGVSMRPTLSWTSSANSAAYDIYLWKSAAGVPSRIATVASLSFTPPAPLEPSTTYSWKVVARASCDAATESSSGTLSFTTAAAPAPAPDAPQFAGSPSVSPQQGIVNAEVFRWTATIRNAASAVVVIIDPKYGGENRFPMTRLAGDTFEFRKTLIYENVYAFRVEAVSSTGVAAVAPAVAGPTVFANAVTPITVDFQFNPVRPLAGEIVRFTSATGGASLTYAWDFGDGTSSGEPNPSHAYDNPGEYDVTLTVSQAQASRSGSDAVTTSATGKKSRKVAVDPKPTWVAVTGKVQLEDGTPIAHAVIEARRGPFMPIYAESNDSGAYSMGVQSGATYTLHARARKADNDEYRKGDETYQSYNDPTIRVDAGGRVTGERTLKVRLPVIMIHGLFGSATRWSSWADALRKQRLPVFAPDYWFTIAAAETLAPDLRSKIDDYLFKTFNLSPYLSADGKGTSPRFNVIAHSKGGLITRVLTYYDHFSNRVRRVVLLGTPNNGVPYWYLAARLGNLEEQQIIDFNKTYREFAGASVFAVAGTLCQTDSDNQTNDQWVGLSSAITINDGSSTTALPALARDLRHEELGNPDDGHESDVQRQTAINAELLAKFIPFVRDESATLSGESHVLDVRCYGSSPASASWSTRARSDAEPAVLDDRSSRSIARVVAQLSAGKETTVALPVDGTTVQLGVYASAGVHVVEVRDSGGALLSSNEYAAGSTANLAIPVSRPEVWSVALRRLAGGDAQPATVGVAVDALNVYQIKWQASPSSTTPARSTQSVAIQTNDFTSPTVTALITHDGLPTSNIPLTNSTGLWSGTFAAPAAAGRYEIQLTVNGRDVSDTPIQRVYFRPFVVASTRAAASSPSADSVLDVDGDGLADVLRVDVPLDVREAGNYGLSADLQNDRGEVLLHAVDTIAADLAGARISQLRFPIGQLDCARLATSRLLVRDLRLVDVDAALAPAPAPLIDYTITSWRPAGSACGETSLSADFTARNTTVAPGTPVQFGDASVGGVKSIEWDFGDGTSSTERNPSHTYSDAGLYYVTLRVRDSTREDFVTHTVTVTTAGTRRHAAPP
jgi:PKD repeat protein/fibronectin type 3 domain-containing protein